MKDNLFNLMKDNDWKIFQNFTKKNLVSSFIIDQKFNKFWFKKKNGLFILKKPKIKFICLTCLLF